MLARLNKAQPPPQQPLQSPGSAAALRLLVKELAVVNALIQDSESAALAAVNAAHNAGNGQRSSRLPNESEFPSSSEGSAPKGHFNVPKGNCVLLRGTFMDEAFDTKRFDGSKPPKNMTEKWSVWHCAGKEKRQRRLGEPKSMQIRGYIWASKARGYCEADRSGTLIRSDAALNEVAKNRGPDELVGTMHGPVALSLHWKHEGGCAYRGDYAVGIPGACEFLQPADTHRAMRLRTVLTTRLSFIH
jgi:hypothetical protein